MLLRVFGQENGDCVNKPSRSVLVGFGDKRKAALQSYSRVGYMPLREGFFAETSAILSSIVYIYIYAIYISGEVVSYL